MFFVNFNAEQYVSELARRMAAAGVSQATLAREMRAGATQVTRWFTTNAGRRRVPTLRSVERIEAAMAALTRRRQ